MALILTPALSELVSKYISFSSRTFNKDETYDLEHNWRSLAHDTLNRVKLFRWIYHSVSSEYR
jgi:hypothetical protein